MQRVEETKMKYAILLWHSLSLAERCLTFILVELWNQRPVYAFSDIHKEESLYTLEQTSPPEAQAILLLNFIMKIPLSSWCLECHRLSGHIQPQISTPP